MGNHSASYNIRQAVISAIALLLAFIWLLPLLYLLNAALKPASEFYTRSFFTIVEAPTLINFVDAWAKIRIYYLTSALNVLVSVPFGIFISSLGAYALARYSIKGQNLLVAYFLLGMLLPAHVTLLPNYLTMKNLGLLDTRLGLFILYTVFNIPFCMYMLRAQFLGIDRGIEESALIDGANSWQVYSRIALPMVMPAAVISGLLCFVSVWNDLVFAITFVQDNMKLPVTAGLLQFVGEFTASYEKITAGVLISALPIIIVFLLFQKHIITGMAEGALKG